MEAVQINQTDKLSSNIEEFDLINLMLAVNFNKTARDPSKCLFRVKLERNELFEKYLSLFEENIRQDYNCACCKSFLRRYGGLVIIDSVTGKTTSAMWRTEEEFTPTSGMAFFNPILKELADIVEAAEVDYYFTRKLDQVHIGTLSKGGFQHFFIDANAVEKSAPFSTMTTEAKRQDFKSLKNNLKRFDLSIASPALMFFEADKDMKSHTKHRNTLNKFKELAEKYAANKNPKMQANFIWDAISSVDKGLINIGNTVVGRFMEHLMTDFTLEQAKSEFLKAVDPLRYFHPTAAASAGTIVAAEKLFAELGLESALNRRFARLDEIPRKLWEPTEKSIGVKEGIFASLKPKEDEKKSVTIDAGVITWAVFERDYLPKADSIKVKFRTNKLYLFGSYVTAVDPESKPIFKHDTQDQRNQFSDFTSCSMDSNGNASGLPASSFVNTQHSIEVAAVTTIPQEFYNQTKPPLFNTRLILKDCHHIGCDTLALFPEMLRHELYPVRSVIEQFSNQNSITGKEDSVLSVMPVGLDMDIFTDNAKITCVIDRLE